MEPPRLSSRGVDSRRRGGAQRTDQVSDRRRSPSRPASGRASNASVAGSGTSVTTSGPRSTMTDGVVSSVNSTNTSKKLSMRKPPGTGVMEV